MSIRIVEVPVEVIKRDPNQPRTSFDAACIRELGQSILTEGCINPIELDKDYVIITGEMRWRACKIAGLKTIPARIISLSPKTRFRRQVIENIHRNTMTDWDTAKALQKLLIGDGSQATIRSSKEHKGGMEDKGLRELSRQIGKSLAFMIEKLDLLKSSPQFQKAVKENKLTSSFLRAIKRSPEELKPQIEKKILDGEFATRDRALQIAVALKGASPVQQQEIMAVSYKGMDPIKIHNTIKKILPDYNPGQTTIHKAFQPSEEIMEEVNRMDSVLEKYSLLDVGSFNIPRVVMGMGGLVRHMKLWLEKPPIQQLPIRKEPTA